MSGTPVSSHGFAVVRGRGYRPGQVDAYAAALSQDRDASWERAARLTVLAKEMEAELEELRERVVRLAPQTYETLGERARRIFQLGQEEAAALRDGARQEARRRVERRGRARTACATRPRRTPTPYAPRRTSAPGSVCSRRAPRPTRSVSPLGAK